MATNLTLVRQILTNRSGSLKNLTDAHVGREDGLKVIGGA